MVCHSASVDVVRHNVRGLVAQHLVKQEVVLRLSEHRAEPYELSLRVASGIQGEHQPRNIAAGWCPPADRCVGLPSRNGFANPSRRPAATDLPGAARKRVIPHTAAAA